MKSMKKYQKRMNKIAKNFSKKGRRFALNNQYGIFFSVLTFVTMMVGVNEYMVRNTDMFLAEFNAKQPSPIVSENVQLAKKTKPEPRHLASQPHTKHR
ncbi:MAG: hypothetical protein HYR96_09875 [Deltaproteobacteria bacterium]|nr:hypothetical protein [Deltaproteobacteria bacterium]MBI3294402.1 hypothetical protein [Deltaproteobacteria bacterium]